MTRTICFATLLAITVAFASRARGAEIPRPQIPDKTFTITDYGAAGDGKTMNTEAIAKAIAACKDAGGGAVEIPPGNFLTGPFKLVSKMELRLQEGATLRFTDSPDA